jgi:flagellar protein FlaI
MSKDRSIVESYDITVNGIATQVVIAKGTDFVPIYELKLPIFGPATHALIEELRRKLISEISIGEKEILEPSALETFKAKFEERTTNLMAELAPELDTSVSKFIIAHLLNESFGLGALEILFNDPNLEEIVVNSSNEPIWVYHKVVGWLKTNIILPRETQIINYAAIIARRVGRSITTLNPLLDAHLVTGDRVNSVLFPISTKGNTITIRKFARKPWTIIDFIENGTLSAEVAALIWQVIQYEGNIIVSGGTATGKTAFLQVCLPFIQPNHRIVSIEDTRELYLPDFMHWVPLTTREPNPEGKGEINMLDLMINALRMRPDRIVVGEIRKQAQAEVLFEAMHTGHSVYSTLHADTALQTISRLTHPPISVPRNMMDAVDLLIVMYRDRRKGFRKVLEVSEILFAGRGDAEDVALQPNTLFRWRPVTNKLEKHKEAMKLWDKLGLYTGMNPQELESDRTEKARILRWLLDNKVKDIESVTKVISRYYGDSESLLKAVNSNKKPAEVIR